MKTETGETCCIFLRAAWFCLLLTLSACGSGGINRTTSALVGNLGINAPSSLPAPGRTLANAVLQEDVLNLLLVKDGSMNAGCKTYKLIDTEVTELPPGPGQKWKERWTLDRCGVPVRYDVVFGPQPKGGTIIGAIGPLQ